MRRKVILVSIFILMIAILTGCSSQIGQSDIIPQTLATPLAQASRTFAEGIEYEKDTILNNDIIFYQKGSDLYLIYSNGNTHKVDIEPFFNPYYCNTYVYVNNKLLGIYDNNNKERSIFMYDSLSKTKFDILEALGIDKKGIITTVSYAADDKIIANWRTKDETHDKLLEINMLNNTHKYISLNLKHSTYYIQSVDFYDSNYILCYYYSNQNGDSGHTTALVDENGDIKKQLAPFGETKHGANIVKLKVSPDLKKMAYSLGQTPVNLYLFDFSNGQSKELCKDTHISSQWANSGKSLYCIEFPKNGSKNRILKRFDQ